MTLLVVDIGGSALKTAIWHDASLVDKQTEPMVASWELLEQALFEKWQRYREKYDLKALHLSLPGVVNQETGYLEGASSLAFLHGVPIRERLVKLIGAPVKMENDANCAALAECHKGAAKGKKNVVFVVVGTGIGGTMVIDGKIRQGHHLYGGEFGMMLIDGRREWAELGSAVHMARKVSIAKGLDMHALSGKEVFALAEQGDDLAQEAVEEWYHYLALGCYNLQYILDPEVILIGGGISQKPDLIAHINRHLTKIMSYGQRSPLTPNVQTCDFYNDANLIGLAYL